MNLWERLEQWFRRRSEGVNDPFLAEPLPERTGHALPASADLEAFWRWVRQEMEAPPKEYSEDLPLFVLQGPTVSGLVVNEGPVVDAPFLMALFEWFRRVLPSLGYQTAHADRRHYREADCLRTVERQAFRPAVMAQIRQGRFPLDQRYGAVTVELTYHNNVPARLRLTVKPLHDRRYAPARPFEELIAALANQSLPQ